MNLNLNVKKSLKEKKGLYLLFFLCFYAFLTIFLVGASKVSVEYSNVVANTELAQAQEPLEYREITELEEVKQVEEDSGEVAGVFKNFLFGTCEARYKIDAPQLFCGDESTDVDRNIKLAQVWAPDILFSGAMSPYDNLVMTTNPSGRPAFRNAAEMINPESDYLINMPPLEEFKGKVMSEEEKKEAFEMHYETLGQTAKVEFESFEKSLCPDVVNKGEFNVKATNKVQRDITGSVTPPGIMELKGRDVAARLCREDVRTIHLDENESYLLCNEGFWDKVKCGDLDYGVIEIKPPEECEGFEGVIIDATLGSGEKCNEGDCGIRYMESGRLLTAPPIWTGDLYPDSLTKEEKEGDYIVDDPVLLTTPCYVRMDCALCASKCIWDLSMWQHIYELEKTFTYPGHEKAYDFDEYWDGVEDEIRLRGSYGTEKL